MNTQHPIRTAMFQPNIPVLDREFDEKSQDIADFILFHAQDHNEDFCFMEFDTQTR